VYIKGWWEHKVKTQLSYMAEATFFSAKNMAILREQVEMDTEGMQILVTSSLFQDAMQTSFESRFADGSSSAGIVLQRMNDHVVFLLTRALRPLLFGRSSQPASRLRESKRDVELGVGIAQQSRVTKTAQARLRSLQVLDKLVMLNGGKVV
jgi:hypothetical protein